MTRRAAGPYDSGMSGYPEHEKLKSVRPLSQAIGEFLTWLDEGGFDHSRRPERFAGQSHGCIELAFHPEICVGERSEHLEPLMCPVVELLAAYFDIDLQRLSDEKEAMVEAASKAGREARRGP